MAPRFSMNSIKNNGLTYAIIARQMRLAHAARRVTAANGAHLIAVQLGSNIISAARQFFGESVGRAFRADCASPFSRHIRLIFRSRSGSQVVGVDATAIIAAVHDNQTFGDFALGELVSDSMSAAAPPDSVNDQVKLTVSIGIARTYPIPTSFGFIDLLPKPIGNGAAGSCGVFAVRAFVRTRFAAKLRAVMFDSAGLDVEMGRAFDASQLNCRGAAILCCSHLRTSILYLVRELMGAETSFNSRFSTTNFNTSRPCLEVR